MNTEKFNPLIFTERAGELGVNGNPTDHFICIDGVEIIVSDGAAQRLVQVPERDSSQDAINERLNSLGTYDLDERYGYIYAVGANGKLFVGLDTPSSREELTQKGYRLVEMHLGDLGDIDNLEFSDPQIKQSWNNLKK